MSNNELHLFVFEGKSAEPLHVDKLERNFLGRRISVKCVFDAEIYQLYRQMASDDFSLDIVNVLKERSQRNAEILREYNRDSFAYVYLFFDYDAHSSNADDDKIRELLRFYDNETENGMLYLSYPMVEALRHYRDMESFKYLEVKCKGGRKYESMKCPYKQDCDEIVECLAEDHYKTLVSKDSRPQLSNINHYDADVWKELLRAHVFKMNYLVNDSYSMPEKTVSQSLVFERQFEKHINHKCPKVAVLSAFPMYVLDYYGVDELTKRLL